MGEGGWSGQPPRRARPRRGRAALCSGLVGAGVTGANRGQVTRMGALQAGGRGRNWREGVVIDRRETPWSFWARCKPEGGWKQGGSWFAGSTWPGRGSAAAPGARPGGTARRTERGAQAGIARLVGRRLCFASAKIGGPPGGCAPAAWAPQRTGTGGRAERALLLPPGLLGLRCPLPRGSTWRITLRPPLFSNDGTVKGVQPRTGQGGSRAVSLRKEIGSL